MNSIFDPETWVAAAFLFGSLGAALGFLLRRSFVRWRESGGRRAALAAAALLALALAYAPLALVVPNAGCLGLLLAASGAAFAD